jgi:hypothetical protein
MRSNAAATALRKDDLKIGSSLAYFQEMEGLNTYGFIKRRRESASGLLMSTRSI